MPKINPINLLTGTLKWKKSFRPESALLIFGDPRSGTTWLADLLTSAAGNCLVDEPLHLNYNSSLKSLGFCWRQSIPPAATWHEASTEFRKMLSGEVPSACLQSNSTFSYFTAKRAVYKTIRGKLLLDWLLKNFHFKRPPVFLVRHPLAVVESIERQEQWQYPFTKFVIPDCPFPDLYRTHFPFLSSLQTNAEQLLAYWCMGNQKLLDRAGDDRLLLFRYSDLVADPELHLHALFRRWGLALYPGILESAKLGSRSSSQIEERTSAAYISGWRDRLTHQHRQRYLEILAYFQIDLTFFDQSTS